MENRAPPVTHPLHGGTLLPAPRLGGRRIRGPTMTSSISAPIRFFFAAALALTAWLGAPAPWDGPETTGSGSAVPAVDFNRHVRPILAERCFPCHGPDQQARKGRLRLDRPDGPDGAYRVRGGVAAIKPGDADRSALWHRITSEDPRRVMPPPGSHKQRLDPEERELLRRWIDDGARYKDHWAFIAPTAPPHPDGPPSRWGNSPIDHFVLANRDTDRHPPAPRADKRTLLRRLSLDLTGLPPTREELASYLADRTPGAYERQVDRLLASPRYGEHMARYWLDLVRFADTNGVHHDHFRDMSPYRDWVIRSFNENTPYDGFVTDQVAGDLHPDPEEDQLIASGFNRLHMIIDRGTALPEESFTRNVIDRVTAVGTAFMGLTVQCAVCHDHKYDPVEQADFYRLFAFFNNFDGAPETGGRSGADFKRGLQPPYISFPTPAQSDALARLGDELEAANARLKELKADLKDADKAARDQRVADRKRADQEVKRLRRERDAVLVNVRAAMVMKERKDPRPAHILIRGNYETPGEQVQRGTPGFLPPLPQDDGAPPTRMDLARWLVSPDHPLTARVAVNRFWQQLFGVGIVKTAEDLGTQGEWPSHPDLLDHLATSFVRWGWDVKRLLKYMVLSATYQQASHATEEAFLEDPENRLLARGSRFRLDAEVIRDQLLASTGLLNTTLYGKSVKPPQPAGIWKAVTLPSSYPRTYSPDSGDAVYRRSIYTFWKRGMPPPQMSILNAPTREFCAARRERTNTPLQALLLLNEPEYVKASRHLALATLARPGTAAERASILYETITSRTPDEDELATLLQLIGDLEGTYTRSPELATTLCSGTTLPTGVSAPTAAAWTMLVSSIHNLDITRTRE